jgi:ketosteroid isomerase-like protein
MSQENVEIVWGAFQRFEEGDMEGVLPYCDENIEIVQPVELPDVPRHQHGHAGVLEAFAVWPEQWDDYRIEVLRVSDIGDDVVVTLLNRGRGKESAIPVESQFTHVFSIREGKIVQWRIFMREQEAVQAVGLED